MIDLHCHILPGVDDGAETMEEAVEMARLAGRDGVQTIVATPHLFKGSDALPDFDLFEEKKGGLEKALEKEGVPISIAMGAEVHIGHSLVDELSRNRKRLVVNGSAYMFVEFPPDHVYPGVRNLFFELLSAGIVPIIAHPERNSVFVQKPGVLYDLVCMGALAQANRGSFLGVYGRTAAAAAGRLLEHNLVHFIASDGHDTVSLPHVLADAVDRVRPLIGDENARALVGDNPRAVLEDREIPYLPSPLDPRKPKRTFSLRKRGFFRGDR
jgi:protein-tyrosine phosphatase